ncbi:hypothetical protein [Burkholderia gladioli]|uniref:hypothetical protein n=1 Tax=Burkholderia gladioli TaxID=28095 RepID=UPI00163E8720|nr:hypothetical protein [Burkholderia gladioli]
MTITNESSTAHAPADGGPAFPLSNSGFDLRGTTHECVNGMTLRDYFAIRAPSEIPDWFRFTPATERPVVPIPHECLTDKQYREWEGLGDWLNLEDVSEEIKAFDARYEKSRDAAAVWDAELLAGRYFAWPWAYADEMLKARG